MTSTLETIVKHAQASSNPEVRAAILAILIEMLPPMFRQVYDSVTAEQVTAAELSVEFGRSHAQMTAMLSTMHRWGLLARQQQKGSRTHQYWRV